MTDRPLDAQAIFDVLVEEGVDFILVGGFAVMAHGYVRGTKDVDIVPDPEPSNLTRLARAIHRLEARVRGMIQLVADLEYADLAPSAVEFEVFGHPLKICGYDHLVAMKEAAGREEDLLDLKRLREARGEG